MVVSCHVVAWNWTQNFWKHSQCSWPLSLLSSPIFQFFWDKVWLYILISLESVSICLPEVPKYWDYRHVLPSWPGATLRCNLEPIVCPHQLKSWIFSKGNYPLHVLCCFAYNLYNVLCMLSVHTCSVGSRAHAYTATEKEHILMSPPYQGQHQLLFYTLGI